ncbi:retron St85 family effector protein [Dyella sp. S184]|uniref:retron St85 family effector protein n=1 Tax=Dyella sp. S184 TaxID=1641862 RepID=UPI00131DA1CC|nr:retron St85 family effector protein [Dyella sp. S184]
MAYHSEYCSTSDGTGFAARPLVNGLAAKPVPSASGKHETLDRFLESEKSALFKHLSELKSALQANRVQPVKKRPSSFIFLCGANKLAGGISARRAALGRFLKKEHPEVRTIIAEDFMKFLENRTKKQNLYDIEQTISNFADVIVIVLESNSAFTELGAFATKDLRKKIFVINDEQFKSAPSFINQGPISAIIESSPDGVAWYKMAAGGVEYGDAIGTIFPAISSAIKNRQPDNELLDMEKLKPTGELNRWAFSFCHDLIFSSRKIRPAELASVYNFLFGKANFDALKLYNALLIALGFVEKNGDYLTSTQLAPLLQIPINKIALQASFLAARHHLDLQHA